jgi:hypothetical protein
MQFMYPQWKLLATESLSFLLYELIFHRITSMDLFWINPTPHDVTMTTTFGEGYSYIKSTSRLRKNDYTRVQLNNYVNANSAIFLEKMPCEQFQKR